MSDHTYSMAKELRKTADGHEATCSQVTMHPSRLHDIAGHIEALHEERDRLQAIVDTLPKTKDGISITPGMRVYFCDIRFTCGRVEKFRVWKVDKEGGFDNYSSHCPHYVRSGEVSVFASEKAAMEHRAKQYADKAAEAAIEAEYVPEKDKR